MALQVTSLFGDLELLKKKFVEAIGQISSQQEFASKLAEAINADEVETMRITSDDMTRLVLEAVAFGTLLNDAEKQVDTIYALTPGIAMETMRLPGQSFDDDDDDDG